MMCSAKKEFSADTLPDPSNSDGDKSEPPDQFHICAPTSELGDMPTDYSNWKSKKRNTILAVLVATLGAFSLGTTRSYSAPVLADPEFKKAFPDIGNGSWVATTTLIGALLSAPITGILIAKLGRKGTMLLVALPYTAGWAMVAFASNTATLYCGRVLTGFCGGTFTVIVPAYVSEVAEDSYRGMLGVSLFLMVNMGALFLFVLGALVNWFVLSVACGCVPLILFFGMMFMPESPQYLIVANKPCDARRALMWLRSAPDESCIEEEFKKIEESVNASRQKGQAKITDLFTLRVQKPVGICCALMLFSRLSGMNGISLFTVQIVEDAETGANASIISIVIVAVQALICVVVPFALVDKLDRRTLLLLSESVMFLTFLVFGIFFYLKVENGGNTPENLKWLPIACLIFITVGFNLGIGSIPWVITAEILPSDVKEIGTSFISIWYWLLTVVSGKTFLDIRDGIGYMGLYWLSAGICLLGAFFVYLVLPETKGKSFEEIQALFDAKNCDNCQQPRNSGKLYGTFISYIDTS